MKKRLIGLLLTVAILCSFAVVGVIPVSAAEEMKTSEACIEILKAEEGFSRVPYWDYAQYTVGYGTKCPDDMLDYYMANGISEAEAEALLYTYLNAFEEDIRTRLIVKYQLTLSQNQFDALIMFSYNCGTGWLYKQQDNLRDAIVSGATGNELIDRFARWCNAGGQILKPLLRRRLCEANMYLNGVYSQTPPENYAYVLFDAAGGVSNPNVQGYDTDLTAEIIPVPTYEGYQFEGWYTERIGGTKVTVMDTTTKNARLYAHWVDAEGKDPAQEEGAEGTKVTVSVNELNIRQGPGTNYAAAGQLNKGDQVTISETAVNGEYTWGKFYGGWIRLDYTDYQAPVEEDKSEPEVPAKSVTGTVNVSDALRVRSGPSTAYSVVGTLSKGTRVEILEQKIVGAMRWGKISNGWISLDYVILDKEQESTPPETTQPEETTPPETTKPEETTPTETTQPEETVPPETTEPPATQPDSSGNGTPDAQVLTGVVKVNDFLRVRSGPGTSYSIAGYLSPNEKVEILEQKAVGSTKWGKIDKGWISLDYVVLSNTDNNSENSSNSGGSSGQKTVIGTVQVNDFLRIRSGPSTSYAVAGYLNPNEKVEILEQKTVGNTTWGRVSKGWVSMDYIRLEDQAKPEVKPDTTVPEQPQKVIKTIIADCLRIRSSASTSSTVVGYLYTGAKVEILETKTVNGTAWGRISNGWICMDYAK